MAQAQEQDPVVTGRNNAGSTYFDTVVTNVASINNGPVVLNNQATPPAAVPGAALVYSQGGVPFYKDAAGNSGALKATSPGATDSSLIAWAFDPVSASNTFILAGGVLFLVKVLLTAPATLTNGLINVTTAGATLTAGQNFVALFNSAGTQIAISPDQTTAFQSAGLLAAAWTTPVANAPAGTYYVAVLANGTTPPTLASGTLLKPGNVSLGNAGLATAASRFLTSGSAQTAVPASVTLSGASGNVAATIWAALS